MTDTAKAPERKKACYVGVPTIFKLELACQQLFRAFGEVPYLVGSSLERPDWRDIDLVMILADEDFSTMFPGASIDQSTWEFDPKWLLMSVMISDWLTHQCGKPVDFKFQPRTAANKRHKGPRKAMGLVFCEGRQMTNRDSAPERMHVNEGIAVKDGIVTKVKIPTCPIASKPDECFGPLYVLATHCDELVAAAKAEGAREAQAKIARLIEALKPFSDMAGEMFARNWDDSGPVIALDNPKQINRVYVSDFFAARRAIWAEHASDCAVHNGTAYPSGSCTCGAALQENADE